MKRAESIELPAVAEELRNLSGHPTLLGPVRWGGKEAYGIDHQLMTDFFITQVKDGKPTIIDRVQP